MHQIGKHKQRTKTLVRRPRSTKEMLPATVTRFGWKKIKINMTWLGEYFEKTWLTMDPKRTVWQLWVTDNRWKQSQHRQSPYHFVVSFGASETLWSSTPSARNTSSISPRLMDCVSFHSFLARNKLCRYFVWGKGAYLFDRNFTTLKLMKHQQAQSTISIALDDGWWWESRNPSRIWPN